MIVLFKSDELANYFSGNYSGHQLFSEIILKGFRKVIDKMMASGNLNELKRIRGLKIEYFDMEWKARINDQYRVHFTMGKNTVIVNKISKHYE